MPVKKKMVKLKKRISIVILVLASIASLFIGNGCRQKTSTSNGPLSRAISETILIEDVSKSTSIITSPDLNRIAYVVTTDNKEAVIVDGKQGKPYDSVNVSDFPFFSPDSKHYVYLGQIGEKYLVVVDGTEGTTYSKIKSFTFSADSKHFAYVATNGTDYYDYNNNWLLVEDAKEMTRSDSVTNFIFSPDGKHLIYSVLTSGTGYLVIDGKPQKQYEAAGSPIYSPDSKHLAYVAMNNGKRFVVQEDQEMKQYDHIDSLTYSPDSKHLAYIALDNEDVFVVKDSQEGERFTAEAIGLLGFSPDSTRLSYYVLVSDPADKWFAVIDGQKGEEHLIDFSYQGFSPEGQCTLFTKDSQHFSYIGTDLDNEWFVVTDGLIGNRYPMLGDLTSSLDSSHFAYTAVSNDSANKFMVVMDKEEGQYYDYARFPTFSPDSNFLAYYAESDGQGFIVVNGTEGKRYTLDGEGQGLPFDVNSKILLNASAELRYIVRMGNKVYRVEEKLSGGKLQLNAPSESVTQPVVKPSAISTATTLPQISRKAVETLVGSAVTGSNARVISPDCLHIAFISAGMVTLDGVQGKQYDNVSTGEFSSDSKHFEYIATKGEKTTVVIDGVEAKPYDDIDGGNFSPDGNHFAYFGKIGKDWYAVIDGKEYGPYALTGHVPFYSDDSRRFAYSAGGLGAEMAIVDGQESHCYPDVYNLTFSPDSKRFAYQAATSIGMTDAYLVIDGITGPHYGGFYDFCFSPDSKHIAYTAHKGANWCVVLDGVESKEYSENMKGVTFSPDSQHLAYITQVGKSYCCVLDGVEGKYYPYINILDIVFSPDSSHTAYIAQDKNQRDCLVVDGVEGKYYQMVGTPVFSDDSQRIAYSAINSKGKYISVIDAIEGPGYDDCVNPIFSPDSRHVIYWACSNGTWMVVVDGTEGKEYQDPGEIYRYISVGRELQVFFVDNSTIRYIAYSDNKIYLVEETLAFR